MKLSLYGYNLILFLYISCAVSFRIIQQRSYIVHNEVLVCALSRYLVLLKNTACFFYFMALHYSVVKIIENKKFIEQKLNTYNAHFNGIIKI